MAGPYSIPISNGSGSENILSGSYTVTTSVTGYDNATVDPASVTIVFGTNSYPFTIAAAGTLTMHVTEEGTAVGTDIVGAEFVRCSSDGLTTYGSAKVSDADGLAVFDHVPFGAGAPAIYYKQTKSDGIQDFDPEVKNLTMATSTQTVEVANPDAESRTMTYTDEYYSGLPIGTGSITLTEV